MTLEEYEKVLEEKRRAVLALKAEERKVEVDKELQSMQILSVKKNNDEVFIKLVSQFSVFLLAIICTCSYLFKHFMYISFFFIRVLIRNPRRKRVLRRRPRRYLQLVSLFSNPYAPRKSTKSIETVTMVT